MFYNQCQGFQASFFVTLTYLICLFWWFRNYILDVFENLNYLAYTPLWFISMAFYRVYIYISHTL